MQNNLAYAYIYKYVNSTTFLISISSIIAQNVGYDLSCGKTSTDSRYSIYNTTNADCATYLTHTDDQIISTVIVDRITDNGGDTSTCYPIDIGVVSNFSQVNKWNYLVFLTN